MMTNKAIAREFNLLANLMELHGENPFKIRSYQNAYLTIRKLDTPLGDLSVDELSAIKGIGKAIGDKIQELLQTGKMQTLEKFKDKTPVGVQDMLEIRGLGPKKLGVIWKQLEVEDMGELLYAIHENRLLELKGFGKKIQAELKQAIEYFQQNRGFFHFATLEIAGSQLLSALQQVLPNRPMAFCGDYARHSPTLEKIELLLGGAIPEDMGVFAGLLDTPVLLKGGISAKTADGYPVQLFFAEGEHFPKVLFARSSSEAFYQRFIEKFPDFDWTGIENEAAVFIKVGLPFLPAPLREKGSLLDKPQFGWITEEDIKGVLHAHSTYSDGQESLETMAKAVHDKGFAYFGITDHSRSAFYANGLKEERVLQQFEEIDRLNQTYTDGFRILKGIECDILYDGGLDYSDEFLKGFDFVIASIHAHLKMDEQKATQRLLRAIEHPATNILGHPTGRLLLSRAGYPVDHRKIIDACAANQVALELNANPYRLDLDWTWIEYALEKGAWIAINPDAHSLKGIEDIHYGVLAAQKGGLDPEQCLNTLDLSGFIEFCNR